MSGVAEEGSRNGRGEEDAAITPKKWARLIAPGKGRARAGGLADLELMAEVDEIPRLPVRGPRCPLLLPDRRAELTSSSRIGRGRPIPQPPGARRMAEGTAPRRRCSGIPPAYTAARGKNSTRRPSGEPRRRELPGHVGGGRSGSAIHDIAFIEIIEYVILSIIVGRNARAKGPVQASRRMLGLRRSGLAVFRLARTPRRGGCGGPRPNDMAGNPTATAPGRDVADTKLIAPTFAPRRSALPRAPAEKAPRSRRLEDRDGPRRRHGRRW